MRDHTILFSLGFAATIIGVAVYQVIATRFGIVALPNERTLHAKATVRGGGIVIALVFLAGVVVLFAQDELPVRWFMALFIGGVVISGVGFVDDIVHLGTRSRLVIHFVLGCWAVLWIGDLQLDLPAMLVFPVAVLSVMWTINLFNFMDGIDGMAASGSTYFCVAAVCLLESSSELRAPILLLGLASAGFLVFNWPPARLFMGDSGSGFYGYTFAVLILASVASGHLSLWTWIILLAYFLGDTTTTLMIRLATVPNPLGTHRSHAYQNLARVWNDHRRMTLSALALQLGWMLPLAIASVAWPSLGLVLAAVALTPPVLLAVKYGPRYGR